MLRPKKHNNAIHGLLSDLGIDRKTDEGQEMYEDMVFAASNGRTKHSSSMTASESQSLINHLNALKKEKTRNQAPDKPNQMRRKILSICRELGLEWHDGNSYNWKRINGWLLKYGCYKEIHQGTEVTDNTTSELLNQYSEIQLPKLVTQFEQLLKSHYAKRHI
jgi:hypothetical protein